MHNKSFYRCPTKHEKHKTAAWHKSTAFWFMLSMGDYTHSILLVCVFIIKEKSTENVRCYDVIHFLFVKTHIYNMRRAANRDILYICVQGTVYLYSSTHCMHTYFAHNTHMIQIYRVFRLFLRLNYSCWLKLLDRLRVSIWNASFNNIE